MKPEKGAARGVDLGRSKKPPKSLSEFQRGFNTPYSPPPHPPLSFPNGSVGRGVSGPPPSPPQARGRGGSTRAMKNLPGPPAHEHRRQGTGDTRAQETGAFAPAPSSVLLVYHHQPRPVPLRGQGASHVHSLHGYHLQGLRREGEGCAHPALTLPLSCPSSLLTWILP